MFAVLGTAASMGQAMLSMAAGPGDGFGAVSSASSGKGSSDCAPVALLLAAHLRVHLLRMNLHPGMPVLVRDERRRKRRGTSRSLCWGKRDGAIPPA
jgi:hypothetical protein